MRALILCFLTFLICAFAVPPALASDKVKAVFLFKFAGYTTWPGGRGDGLTICTYGGDSFDGLLEKVAALQKTKMQVRHIEEGGSLQRCALVFLEDADFLPMVEGLPVLTVSDDKKFAKKGGMIEMRQTSERLKLIVNMKSLKGAGLSVSSRLLKLAEVIR